MEAKDLILKLSYSFQAKSCEELEKERNPAIKKAKESIK